MSHHPFQEATHTLSPLTPSSLTMLGFDVATQLPGTPQHCPTVGRAVIQGMLPPTASRMRNSVPFAQGRMLQGSTFPAKGSTRNWDFRNEEKRRQI